MSRLKCCRLLRAVRGVSAGPVCSRFSQAIAPAWRDAANPEEKVDLLPEQADKVRQGNAMLDFRFRIVAECQTVGLVYLIENPLNSWMWRQPGWKGWESIGARLIYSLTSVLSERRGGKLPGSGPTDSWESMTRRSPTYSAQGKSEEERDFDDEVR